MKDENVELNKSDRIGKKQLYVVTGIIAAAIVILAASIGYSAYSNRHVKPLALDSYTLSNTNLTPPPISSSPIATQLPSVSKNVTQKPVASPKTDYSFQISKIKTALDLANGYNLQKMLDSNQKYYDECMQFSSAPNNADYCANSKQQLDAKVNGDNAELQLRKDNLNHLLQVFQTGNPTQADFDLYNKTINF